MFRAGPGGSGRIAAGPWWLRGSCPDLLGFRLTRGWVSGKLQACHSGRIAVLLTGSVTPLVTSGPTSMPSSAWTPHRWWTPSCRTICCAGPGNAHRQDAGFAAWVLAAVRRGIGVADGYADTLGWLSWKSGTVACRAAQVLRWAELCELFPETGAAWREGQITTTAVELIAAARVPGFDDELVAMEAEFLDRARRGDHKSLADAHHSISGPVPGLTVRKPDQPDGVTVAEVGDRGVLAATSPRRDSRPSATRSRRSPGPRPRTTSRRWRTARPRA